MRLRRAGSLLAAWAVVAAAALASPAGASTRLAATPPAANHPGTTLPATDRPATTKPAAVPLAAGSRGSGASQIVMVAQTPWVAPGQPFNMTLRVTGAAPPDGLEVGLDVFSRLTSRSAFDQSVESRFEGNLLTSMPFTPLRALSPSGGQFTVQVPTASRGRPGLDLSGCAGGCDGVYPVRVQLASSVNGAVVGQLDTHLVYGTAPGSPDKVDLALVLPLQAPTPAKPADLHHLAAGEVARLSGIAQSFDQAPSVRASFVAGPATIQALATSAKPEDKAALLSLQRLTSAPGHELEAAPYVPLDLSAMAASGLNDQVQAQLARGAQALSSGLGERASRSTWVTTGPLDQAGLDLVVAQGYRQVVVPAASLVAVQSKLAESTSTFPLAGRGGEPLVTAAVADQGLAAHFVTGDDPVLAAHQFLADLAMIYFDNPGARPKAVVAQAPLDWSGDPSFLRTLLSGLTDPGSFASTATIGDVFRLFQASRDGSTRRLVSAAAGSVTLPATKIRGSSQRLSAFSSVVGGVAPVVTDLGDLILASQAVDLRSGSRDAYLAAFSDGLDSQLSLISLPVDRSVTVTGQAARIPITVVSNAPYPVHAVLGLASDKLSFPNGSTKPLVLDRHDNAEYFEVRSRTSGAFPLDVSLVSPEGQLVLAHTRYTVRSTAVSGVAVFLSVGAALFLVAWWVRSALKGRRERNRRLVPPPGG